MNYVALENGVKMPQLGFGVFQVTDLSECEESVLNAIKTGYRLIDTAAVYRNEEAVGRAIKRSGIPRNELFITSKLGVVDGNYDAAKKAYQRSLDKLQLDYLDLYLIHQPYNDVFGAWRAMEELYESGKIKAIGVSNFTSSKLVDFVLNNKIKPMVNQIETHPFNQQIETHKVMEENGIVHEGWAPFAEGKNDLFSNKALGDIAKTYGKSIGQIVLRWNIQRNIVVIPKSVHKERISENFDIFDFELDREDMDKITKLDKGRELLANHEDPEFVKMLYNRGRDK